MHMHMRHGLARALTIIDSNVVTLRMKLLVDDKFGIIQQGQDVHALLYRELKNEPAWRFGIASV
jgi:hypothetical protein